ncbi:hypothetical protein ABPG73_021239 [Tetrahymena malaccensis]
MNSQQPKLNEQQIIDFLFNNRLIYQKKLGEGCYSIVVQAYSPQHQSNVAADTFSIGIIILQALLNNQLESSQIMCLKSMQLDSVLPNLKNHEQYTFIQEILSCMVENNPKNRKGPAELIQKLKFLYQIDQNCLKKLILPKLENFNQIQQKQKKQIFSKQNCENSTSKVSPINLNLKSNQSLQNNQKQLQEISLNQMVNNKKIEKNEIKQIDQQMYNELKHLVNKKQVKLDYDKKALTNEQIQAISAVLNECSELEEIKLQFNGSYYNSHQSLFPLFDSLKKQSNLLSLVLGLGGTNSTKVVLNELSKILPTQQFLNKFVLAFSRNNCDNESFQYLINNLVIYNTQIEVLRLYFLVTSKEKLHYYSNSNIS